MFAASSRPGAVEAELASRSVITNLVPQRGHFSRLPGLIPGGQVQDDAAMIALSGLRHKRSGPVSGLSDRSIPMPLIRSNRIGELDHT